MKLDPTGDLVPATPTRRGRGGPPQMTVTSDAGVPIDEYVGPGDVAGVEIYRTGMLAPPQFQPPEYRQLACSIIVVWTKHHT